MRENMEGDEDLLVLGDGYYILIALINLHKKGKI